MNTGVSAIWSRARWWPQGIILVAVVALIGAALWLALARPAPAAQPATAAAQSHPAIELSREAGRLWVAGDREQALEKWEEAHHQLPESLAIRESLARTHFETGRALLQEGTPDQARGHLEAARQLLPQEVAIRNEYQALRAYLAGREALAAREWDQAIRMLAPLNDLDPDYLDARALLEVAFAAKHQVQVEQQARRGYALSQVRMTEPGQQAHALLPALAPLVSGPKGKHIVVSINAQRMYVYEDGKLIWNWVASTGETGRPTIPGRYRIQSKFENARSNVWSLWMPYWQGIYWAGSVENGIHGQVTFDAGGRLWEGLLGSRVTYGCVMISDEHAAILFNWTEMGTPVSIHWDWNPDWIPDDNGDPVT
jgi:lipoprotein-anchoring transpeptidase ErfK/SrfK